MDNTKSGITIYVAKSGQNEDESKSEDLGLNLSSPPPPPHGSILVSHSLVSDLRSQISSETSDNNRLTPKNLDELAMRAAGLLREAGGLIGSRKPIRQLWGRVLMVLALAIAAMVAAVALMSMLGFATPAFLVPYFAAIQASSMVSTVLNFVAAKLTLDLNTAAAVTAVATAGTLGMFGKAIHYSGAPTQLKCDLDRAAQDLEAALSETDAANNMSMN